MAGLVRIPRGYAALSYLLLLAFSVVISANNNYSIFPTCPGGDTQCLTLPDTAKEAGKYFTSNTTLVFYPGDHNLRGEVVFVASISGLTLVSYNDSSGPGSSFSNPRIRCDESFFSFSGVSGVQIVSITFISCGIKFSSTVAKLSSIWLENSKADIGGAIAVCNGSNITFSGDSGFMDNTATTGGAVFIDSSNLTFSGTVTFLNNTAAYGGSMATMSSSVVAISGNSTFSNNRASRFGGALYANVSNTLSFAGDSHFIGNTAYDGGAVHISHKNTISFQETCTFEGNFARNSGGAVSSIANNKLSFHGISNFIENVALIGGGISAGRDSSVNLTGITEFSRNQATYGGGIFVLDVNVSMNVNAVFSNNSASEVGVGIGGAIHAVYSRVSLGGSYLISENTAMLGGGLYISVLKDRLLFLNPGTNMSFVGNIAHGRGGAIHAEDNPLTYCILEDFVGAVLRELCFFQVLAYVGDCDLGFEGNHIDHNISLSFVNNTATESGHTMYGGNLEKCAVCSKYDGGEYVLGKTVLQELTSKEDLSDLEIASDPLIVYICEDNIPNCDKSSIHFAKYPGQTLSINVIAVGQMNGTVPSIIRAVSDEIQLSREYTTQPAENNRNCTELQYPLLVNSTDAPITTTLKLYSDQPCSTSGYPFIVNITFLPCPTGFSLSEGKCSCDGQLRKYTQDCDITDQTITRQGGSDFWVGVYPDNISDSQDFILHPQCPFDYCTDETVKFSLNTTDIQCQNKRSGVLCGACQSGYSLALGSSRCISDCSSKFLALLLPFAAAGLGLVVFLFLCNLTVAEGTISGLIFYANIVAINQSVFFPSGDGNVSNILTVFLAWMNLDLGIETCFLTSLDMYSRTWLQFVFPFYIWALVGLIVYLADISSTITKLVGSTNPVAVLATLLLLSYTKLLRTTMAAFSFTTLSYPKDEARVVWLYDGNIGYWNGRHVTLFLGSLLVFLILFLPYTLLLLCGQWIQSKLQLRWLSPAKQLYMKSFFDAYYAPYQDKHRYWTGLLLLVRFFVLLLSTIINIHRPYDPHTNLLVMVVIGSCLLAWVSRGIYKKWYLDALEASFIFNLIVLAVGTYHVHLSGGNQATLVYTSTGIAFVTFIVIVTAAVVQRLWKTRFGSSFARQIRTLCHPNRRAYNNLREEPTEPPPVPAVAISIVEIDRNQISESSEYRESALELITSNSNYNT